MHLANVHLDCSNGFFGVVSQRTQQDGVLASHTQCDPRERVTIIVR